MKAHHDVIIVGGGPAGLNAAIVLRRCLYEVLVFDLGKQRNRRSRGIHNYLTRDHIAPTDFLNLAHEELLKYEIPIEHKEIVSIEKKNDLFYLVSSDGKTFTSNKVLLATGVKDNLPDIPGIDDFYGTSIYHCPYCDAWEMRDKKIAVYGKLINGTGMSLMMKTWSPHITLFTDGIKYLRRKHKDQLIRNNIPFITDKIKKLHGKDGLLQKIIMENGDEVECDALFFTNGLDQSCVLAKQLGCNFDTSGIVITNSAQSTSIKGLYIAGDATRDMQFVVIAAAEGVKAAIAIHEELHDDLMGKYQS